MSTDPCSLPECHMTRGNPSTRPGSPNHSRIRVALAAASERPWFVVGLPWNQAAPWINAGSEDPHGGHFVCDFVNYDDTPTEAARSEPNAELVCLAVNAIEPFLDLEKAAREVARLYATIRPAGQLDAAVSALKNALGRLDDA